MANIKPLDQASEKWVRRAQVAQPDYLAGVQNPRTSWSQAASAADQNYRQAIVAAANAGRYAAGVKRAGDDRWREGATRKGPARYAEGVAIAAPTWQEAFRPYAEAIQRVQLPPRGPTGAPQNIQRIQAITSALRALKEGRK